MVLDDFLQMMDAGGTTVSSYAPNNVNVVGFAQYTKAGEQSLMILPLRLYDYIPMLDRIEYEARHRLLDKKEVTWRFMNCFPDQYPLKLNYGIPRRIGTDGKLGR